MPTALDAPKESLDPSEQSFVAAIREHGWFRTHISADDEGPGYSFSTGFWTSTKQPELLLFGTRSDIAHDVLWDLFRLAEQRRALPIGRRTDQVFANLPAYLSVATTSHAYRSSGLIAPADSRGSMASTRHSPRTRQISAS